MTTNLERGKFQVRTDGELIVAHRTNGCRGSLDELLRRHLPEVRALVLHMVLHDAMADDVTQEVFLRVSRYLPTFDVQSKFSSWLYRVAMNTIHTHIERQQRLKIDSIVDLSVGLVSNDAVSDSPLMGEELQREIDVALGQLSPKLRAAIVLTMLHQQGIGEAARIEGCAITTMFWRVHSARKQLQQRLAKHLES